jgi:hypothetical protein
LVSTQSPSDGRGADSDANLDLRTSIADEEALSNQGNHSQDIEMNPCASDFDPMLALSHTLRDTVSSYVYSLTVASIRKASKALGVKQYLQRAKMRGLLFAAAAERVHSGEAEWIDVLGDDCIVYVTDPANQTNLWRVAPNDNELYKWRPADARDGRCRTSRAAVVERTERQFDGDADPSSMKSPSFAVSEFGSLICILLQVTSVRQDLLQSGINLTRAQTDRRKGRDSFWALSVECVFNDPGVRVGLASAGHLDDVDVNAVVISSSQHFSKLEVFLQLHI